MSDNVHFGDVVISDQLTYHDVRPQQMQKHFPYKASFTPSSKLVELAKQAGEVVLGKEYKYHVGKIVTGEQFVTEQALKQRIADSYHPLCVEMEGAAIGHVAEINGVDFVVIRSISDHANENTVIDYDVFEALAANQSASLVLQMLEHIN
jgi:adenosylhomocysteine nucleosidase